jgi:hypothetical protein
MKTQINNEGSTKPQTNTARLLSEKRPETVTVSDATPVTKRYRLVCEGTSMWIKAQKLSREELRIAKSPIEEDRLDLYTLSILLDEHGFDLDIGNPNQHAEYELPLANEVYLTLYDPEGRKVLFVEPIENGGVEPKRSIDLAPQSDGSTVVNLERFCGDIRAYILEAPDVPLREDFSTELYEIRIGDETLTFLDQVRYKGEVLEHEDDENDSLVQDHDFRMSWAILV